jgi:hypothetical protein
MITDNAQKQLKTRQICLFYLAFTISNKLFTLPSTIADVCSNDAWLSTLLSVMLDTLSIVIMLIVSKNNDKDFFELLTTAFSRVGAIIVSVIYFIYFFLKSIIPIMEQREYIDLTLYIPNPSFLYFLPFFIVCIYICSKKLRLLGRLSDILFITTLLGFITLMALSISHADFSNLLPVGINGTKKIFSGTFLSLNWFGDCVYFLFFIGNFKRNKKDGVKITLSYLFSGLLIVLFLMVFYGIFTSIAYRQKFSLTEISKYTTIINSTGRFDYLAIMLLLFSNVITISLPLFFCCKILERIITIKNRFIMPVIVSALSLLVNVLISEHVYSMQKTLITFFGIFYFFMANVFPIIIILLGKRRKNENAKV